jgi:hypothetical protein
MSVVGVDQKGSARRAVCCPFCQSRNVEKIGRVVYNLHCQFETMTFTKWECKNPDCISAEEREEERRKTLFPSKARPAFYT